MIVFSIGIVIFGLGVVSLSNILYSGLSLLAMMAGLGVFYIIIGQEYLGIMQLIIYAGAIMVLIIFMIMLLNTNKDRDPPAFDLRSILSVGLGIFIWVLFYPLASTFYSSLPLIGDYSAKIQQEHGAANLLALDLFGRLVLIVELLGLLLLIGVVAAVVLTKSDFKPDAEH